LPAVVHTSMTTADEDGITDIASDNHSSKLMHLISAQRTAQANGLIEQRVRASPRPTSMANMANMAMVVALLGKLWAMALAVAFCS